MTVFIRIFNGFREGESGCLQDEKRGRGKWIKSL